VSEAPIPDQSRIKQIPGADLDLTAEFDRFMRDVLGREQPGALHPVGLLLQLFCLMIWQNESRAGEDGPTDARAPALAAFFEKLFRTTENTNPHLLISRGLSFLNFLEAPPLETPALDLGCETGLTAQLLFERRFRYGIDITPQWEPSIKQTGMHEEYRIGSADAIPLAAASVRSVVMNNVIYHAADRERALREVFRCLEPGGRVYFDDLAPLFFEAENRPFVEFMRTSGGHDFAREYMRKRYTMYMSDRTINAVDSRTPAQYVPFMESLGFHDVQAKYFFGPALLRAAYNFLDMGFIFGSGALSPQGAKYVAWVRERLALDLLHDADACAAAGGGGYVFVTATKPH